ncbi:hypothetical protein IMX07_07055 [bacterium]|nr:hypothetical protein [bacterium]
MKQRDEGRSREFALIEGLDRESSAIVAASGVANNNFFRFEKVMTVYAARKR